MISWTEKAEWMRELGYGVEISSHIDGWRASVMGHGRQMADNIPSAISKLYYWVIENAEHLKAGT